MEAKKRKWQAFLDRYGNNIAFSIFDLDELNRVVCSVCHHTIAFQQKTHLLQHMDT